MESFQYKNLIFPMLIVLPALHQQPKFLCLFLSKVINENIKWVLINTWVTPLGAPSSLADFINFHLSLSLFNFLFLFYFYTFLLPLIMSRQTPCGTDILYLNKIYIYRAHLLQEVVHLILNIWSVCYDLPLKSSPSRRLQGSLVLTQYSEVTKRCLLS